MTTKSRTQYAEVEQSFGQDPPVVHCPVCGQATVKMVDGTGEYNACPHLAFIYHCSTGGFGYRSPDFKTRTEKLEMDEPDPESFKNFLQNAGYDNGMMAIEITYGGMACGPMSFTDVYGFDWNHGRHP